MIWDRESEHWLAPDDIYNRDRDERDQLADSLDDDAYSQWELSQETPDDRRTILALRARKAWMESR